VGEVAQYDDTWCALEGGRANLRLTLARNAVGTLAEPAEVCRFMRAAGAEAQRLSQLLPPSRGRPPRRLGLLQFLDQPPTRSLT
jgi:hypothetical protein